MENFSLGIIVLIFLVAGGVTWLAGITLAKTTDTLDTRFKLGDAIGGLVLLGVAGSLPEIAVVYSAARHGHIPVIIGNLIGGLAIQTLLIVIFDIATKGKRPLSYLAGSILLSIETVFAIVITVFTLIGTFVPAKYAFFKMNPLSIVIFVTWILGLFILNRARKNPRLSRVANDGNAGRKHHERRGAKNHPFYVNRSTLHVFLVFLFGCVITLAAGVLLEESGTLIAGRLGIGSGIFAATAIALVTSLPEISTGLESIFIGDNQLAISDIMGSNAFMLVLFLFADLFAHKPVLSYAAKPDLLFGYFGIAMMLVYAISFVVKLRKRYFRMGLDSILEILLYAGGVAALIYLK